MPPMFLCFVLACAMPCNHRHKVPMHLLHSTLSQAFVLMKKATSRLQQTVDNHRYVENKRQWAVMYRVAPQSMFCFIYTQVE